MVRQVKEILGVFEGFPWYIFKKKTKEKKDRVQTFTEIKPVKSKRGREEGDGTENVINWRNSSQIVVTFYDEFSDDL